MRAARASSLKYETDMAYEVVPRCPAKASLARTVSRISHELDSPQAAASLLDAFEEVRNNLGDMPYSYPAHRQASKNAGASVRRAPVNRYALFYLVDKESSRIVDLAFHHEQQDVSRNLWTL